MDEVSMGTEIIKTLYKLAHGYRYTEQEVDEQGEVVSVERYVRPNIAAIRFLQACGRSNHGLTRKGV